MGIFGFLKGKPKAEAAAAGKDSAKAEELFQKGYSLIDYDFVKPENRVAVKCFTKAAKMGNANAMGFLGEWYRRQIFYVSNKKKAQKLALEWLTKAVELGNPMGQYSLGECYCFGHGVPQDYVKAVELYAKSANQGFWDGMYMLGVAYEIGRGVSKDMEKAIEWFTLAANQGHIRSKTRLEEIMNEPALEAAKKRAEELVMQGEQYEKAGNYDKAMELYTEAAGMDSGKAKCNMGRVYYYQYNDLNSAIEWLEKGLGINQRTIGTYSSNDDLELLTTIQEQLNAQLQEEHNAAHEEAVRARKEERANRPRTCRECGRVIIGQGVDGDRFCSEGCRDRNFARIYKR